MKKILYLSLPLILIVVLATFSLRRVTIRQINNCILQSNISAHKILIAGEIIKFEQDEDWLKFRINLCQQNFFNLQTVNIVISVNARKEISIGQEVTIENTQGYSWRREKISNLGNLLQEGQLLVFRLEPFISTKEILSGFPELDINNCSLSRECSLRLGFWNSYGTSQAEFIQHLNNQEYSKILQKMMKNEITVFASGLGSLDSLDKFTQLAEGKLI